ncbi:MAG: M48 family metalloprotease [Nitrospirota bacterium]
MLASIIIFWFSREREYRADSGSADLVGKKPMIGALEALKASLQQPHLPDQMAAFGISGTKKPGLQRSLQPHPNPDDRINNLMESRYPDYKP